MGLFGNDKPAQEMAPAGVGESDAVENNRSGPAAAAFVSASEGLKKRGRGRPRKDGGESASGLSAGRPAGQTQAQIAAMEPLFSPEVWAPIVTLPADAMLALTGHAHWNLGEGERKTLSATASTAMRYIGVTSPKSLAISLFAMAFITAYLPRAVKEFGLMREERLAKLADGKTKT